jgi:hypothetical protein
VQLATADQHRADLGQLAALAGQPVGLRVDGEELGGGEGELEHGPPSIRPEPDVLQRAVRYGPPAVRSPLAAALVLAGAAWLAGCGDTQPRANDDRPAVPVMMTAAVHDDVVQVSPTSVGAGPITLVVSNQSTRPQRVTFETDELGARTAGRRASTATIAPQDTGRLTIDARTGRYSVHVADRTIRAASVRIGPPRASGQDRLLLP